MNTDVQFADLNRLSELAIGAAFEVSNQLGSGFLESVYQQSMLHELELRGLKAEREVSLPVSYKGRPVGHFFADILVENRLVLELKAVDKLAPAHVGQLLNYLRAADLKLGLILNFGSPRLELKRVTR